jgi:hypothetical protein
MKHFYVRPIRNAFISTALAAALLLAGCSSQPLSTREKGTIAGGAIGLGTGALVGAAVGAPGAGAAIGGVVGAGTGYAIDLGVGVVVDRWEVGFGADGVANRIDWTGVTQQTLRLGNLQSGNGTFIQSAAIPAPDARVELPVDYRGNVTYNAGDWTATAEVGHGFGGGSFHGGYEHRFGGLAARGGARYTFGMWNPTGGIGVDLSRKVSLDVAAFGTTTNIEQKRQLALAVSIRINHFPRP